MDPKGKFSVLSIAALLLGLSACATAAQTPPPPPPPPPPAPTTTPCDMKPHDQVIDVGTAVGCKLSFLHIKLANSGKGNTLLWRSTIPRKNIKIVVDSPIFPDLVATPCDGSKVVCLSGYLDPNTPFGTGYAWLYHAYLCDDSTHCGPELDPGIIIVP